VTASAASIAAALVVPVAQTVAETGLPQAVAANGG
jgi:hypothetical protein